MVNVALACGPPAVDLVVHCVFAGTEPLMMTSGEMGFTRYSAARRLICRAFALSNDLCSLVDSSSSHEKSLLHSQRFGLRKLLRTVPSICV